MVRSNSKLKKYSVSLKTNIIQKNLHDAGGMITRNIFQTYRVRASFFITIASIEIGRADSACQKIRHIQPYKLIYMHTKYFTLHLLTHYDHPFTQKKSGNKII